MTESTEGAFCLRAAADDGVHPVLAGVQAQGRLDGLLFSLTLRQTYRNTSRRTLEVVYTFPLPLSAVLLGFAAEFSGRRVECEVMPRTQAEEVYENALADGDAPALLEAGPDGLYTANIGNLKRGEEVVLEMRFAQLVAFEQGRLRLAVPMTIAPRYGNPESSGLHAHQVPEVSIHADYPLELSVQVAGDLATGGVECPTHPTRCTSVPGGLAVALAEGARMDRDVVLLVSPDAQGSSGGAQPGNVRPHVLTWSQGVALAAFELPPAPLPADRQGLALKLLVDCSGSMGGDSIESARRALLGVAQGLTDRDEVSFTRFGSSSQVVVPPRLCTPATLSQLVQAVQATDADLGGTEMEKALMAVFALHTSRADSPPGGKPKGQERDQGQAPCAGNADVLLITDGEVWDTARMISAAQRSGHRVFVIGVGTSPAEAVLRHLADATGGACEFATPGEALEAAAARMLHRMRQGVWAGLRVQWGAGASGDVAPSWALPVQKRAFAGDTLLALAGFEGLEDAQALGLLREARLMAEGEDGQARELCRIASTAVAAGDDLPRIAAARRVAMGDARDASDGMTDAERGDEPAVDTSPAQQARALALQYKLITRHTHGVLVHKRTEEDKPEDEAHLHRVQSMLAAGWGNTGRVASHRLAAPVAHMRFSKASSAGLMLRTGDHLSAPSVWRSARTQATGVLREAMDSIEIPAFLRKRPTVTEAVTEAAPLAQAATTLADMSGAVADHLAGGGAVQDLASLAQGFTPEPAMESALAMAIEELRELLSDEAAAWLMLALWVAQRPEPDGNPAMAAVLAGPASQAGWSAEAFALADDVLYVLLSGFSSQGGMTGTSGKRPGRRATRKERLAAALSGTGG